MGDKMTLEDFLRRREDLAEDRENRHADVRRWFIVEMGKLMKEAADSGLVDSFGRFPNHKRYDKDGWDTLIDTVKDILEVYHGPN